jgi:hypothetical protein
LELCRRQLADSSAEKAIVLLNDGAPTCPCTSGPKFDQAKEVATQHANAAKDDDGITLITVFVDGTRSSADYLKTLSSDDSFLQARRWQT